MLAEILTTEKLINLFRKNKDLGFKHTLFIKQKLHNKLNQRYPISLTVSGFALKLYGKRFSQKFDLLIKGWVGEFCCLQDKVVFRNNFIKAFCKDGGV